MRTLRSRTWAVAPMLVVALLGTEKVSGFVTVSFMLPRVRVSIVLEQLLSPSMVHVVVPGTIYGA